MQIEHRASEHAPDVLVIALSGEVDNVGAREVDDTIREMVEQGHKRIILDLSDVSYLNSAGLGVIAMLAKRARSQEGDVAMIGVNGRVRRTVELVRLDRVVPILATEEEACVTLLSSCR